MRRVTLFAKGNVDLHDSLHSCVIAGELKWNGINEVVRRRFPGTLVRLRHETWTRTDALLQARGVIPSELMARALPLGAYPAASQFSGAVFDTGADAIVLSILSDTGIALFRHRRSGFLFYPTDAARWPIADRDWLKAEFEPLGLLDVSQSMANLERVITLIRQRSDVPILVYNISSTVPGEVVHCLQGLGEIFATRIRRFNLGLADLSAATGISIIDVDALVARAGADRLKLDAIHLAPDGYRLVAEEVVRVLEDLNILKPEADECAPA